MFSVEHSNFSYSVFYSGICCYHGEFLNEMCGCDRDLVVSELNIQTQVTGRRDCE